MASDEKSPGSSLHGLMNICKHLRCTEEVVVEKPVEEWEGPVVESQGMSSNRKT